MFALKRFVRSAGAAIALTAACVSTSANAGWRAPLGFGVGPGYGGASFGMNMSKGFGVGPENNGFGFGPFGPSLGINPTMSYGFRPLGWGMSPEQNVGMISVPSWGMSPEQNVGMMSVPSWGIAPSFKPTIWIGIGPQQNVGLPLSNPWMGTSPEQAFCADCRPAWLGYNPTYGYGMGPQQTVGTGMLNPWMGMNPNMPMMPQPVVAQTPAGLQGVQCMINGVAVLTKDADDCERADGEVAKPKTKQ